MEIELKGNDDDTEQTCIHLAEPFLLENKHNTLMLFFCTDSEVCIVFDFGLLAFPHDGSVEGAYSSSPSVH